MKKEVIAFHCDEKPRKMLIEEGDKAAFLCERCDGMFEIDSNGDISRSPLREGDVTSPGVIYEMRRGRAITNGDVYKS